MTSNERPLEPALTFPADFAEDWERLDDKARADIVSFLKRLQADPFDPAIMAVTEKSGGYSATGIGPVVIYWKLARKDDSFEGALAPPEAIYVLAVHPAAEVAQ